MKKLTPGIRLRIFSGLLGFSVLLLGLLSLFQIVFLDDFYKAIKERDVRRSAADVSALIREEEWDTLGQYVKEHGDIYIEVWTERYGTTLVTTGNVADAIQARLTLSAKRALFRQIQEQGALSERFHYEETTFGRQKRRIEGILYADLLESWDGTLQLLMVSSNLTPVRSTVDTLRVQLYIVSAAMLLLSVIIALFTARQIAKPIVKLNKAAGELGKGNYDVTFDAGGYREVAQLSATLTHAAQELSRTEQLRRELIANVSHDLRTPLTLITGYCEMMRDLPGEDNAENLQVIVDESRRLTSLVNDLLDLSRLEAGTLEIRPRELSLTAAVAEIIGRLSRLCEQDRYHIHFQREGEAIVLADPERISQVIYNLLLNALTWTGDDRTVTVRQSLRGERVVVEVVDTGGGIPPEELPTIWERYYRSSESHRRSVAGAGLGLSIVRSILEAHPGVEYGVRSQVGQGSCFWFSLPVVEFLPDPPPLSRPEPEGQTAFPEPSSSTDSDNTE